MFFCKLYKLIFFNFVIFSLVFISCSKPESNCYSLSSVHSDPQNLIGRWEGGLDIDGSKKIIVFNEDNTMNTSHYGTDTNEHMTWRRYGTINRTLVIEGSPTPITITGSHYNLFFTGCFGDTMRIGNGSTWIDFPEWFSKYYTTSPSGNVIGPWDVEEWIRK